MTSSALLLLLVGLLIGAAFAALALWLPARARANAQQAATDDLRERLASAERDAVDARRRADALSDERAAAMARAERIDPLEREAIGLKSELAVSRGRAESAERNVAELSARIEEQQRAAEGRLQELQSARERMKAEFQALAADILEDKSKRFTEQNAVQMSAMLNPLREQIGDFRKLVSESYEKEGNARVALQTELQGELKRLLDLNLKLSDEANSLTRALTTDNRTQGYWGELKLERLLESAGLEKGEQYLTQESFNDADGDRYRPDAVLLLPEGRHIVIDAKMNLVDYQRGCDGIDDA